MGAIATAAIYCAYILLLFAIAISLKGRPRSDRRVLDEFFSYVRIGRKRAAMLQDHLLAFATLQLAYPIIALLLKVPAYVSFALWLAISLVIFYLYSIQMDVIKRHRHNGIAIGYEYPHPVENRAIKTETQTVGSITMGGSKGIYDLQIKSEPNPHIMVIGATGMGKSNLITTLLARAYLKFKIPFLIIDWSGAYKGIDVNVWTVPTNLRVNPFLLRGKSIERRAGIASELLQIALGLTDMQTQKVRETLDLLYHEGSEPSIQMLHNRLTDEISTQRYKETKLQLTYITNKLRQAYEIFGSEPKEFWDNYDRTCNIVSLSGLTDMEKKLVTHTIMQRITEEFRGEQGTKLYIALDDAYQALLNYYGKETNITKIVREGRKYGFGLVIATQLLQDMPEAIPANTSVKFILGYHEASTLQRLYSMLKLSDLEKSILFRIPVGHALLFDQNAIQNGKPNPAYIEIDVVKKDERKKLAEEIKRLDVKGNYDIHSELKPGKGVHNIIRKIEIPSVSVYRFLIAFDRTKNLTEAYKMLRAKGWITSLTTIYGNKSKPSLEQRATDSGYYSDGKLTQKAFNILEPYKMIQKQGNRKGGEEHTGLMENTIKMVQDKGNYAFVMEEREAFDVGELKVDPKIKGMWNYYDIAAYEIQTNAIKSEIDRCIEKAKEQNTELVFITNSKKTKGEIERLTENKYIATQ